MSEVTPQHIVFIIISVVTLASATVVVTARNLFYAALSMMVSFLGVAAFYALLEAGFLAAAQLLVYIGAISVLIIFAIMMTRRLMQTNESPFNSQALSSAVAAVLVFILMFLIIARLWAGDVAALVETAPAVPGSIFEDMVVDLGRVLVSPDGYIIPFELISLLLLGALIGSIYIAHPKDD